MFHSAGNDRVLPVYAMHVPKSSNKLRDVQEAGEAKESPQRISGACQGIGPRSAGRQPVSSRWCLSHQKMRVCTMSGCYIVGPQLHSFSEYSHWQTTKCLHSGRFIHAGPGAQLGTQGSPAASQPDIKVCVDDDSTQMQDSPSPAKPAASGSGLSASMRQSASQDLASPRAAPSEGAPSGGSAPSGRSDVSQGSAASDAGATSTHDTGKWQKLIWPRVLACPSAMRIATSSSCHAESIAF